MVFVISFKFCFFLYIYIQTCTNFDTISYIYLATPSYIVYYSFINVYRVHKMVRNLRLYKGEVHPIYIRRGIILFFFFFVEFAQINVVNFYCKIYTILINIKTETQNNICIFIMFCHRRIDGYIFIQ